MVFEMERLMSCRLAVRAALITMVMSAVAWAAPPIVRPWVPFGPDGGDARRIVPDPHDHAHLYLGTTNGWIYQSHDAGASWTRLAQVGKRDDLVLDSIVVDADNPKHLVVGAWVIDYPEAGLDGGMYYSYDAGATWTVQAEMRGQSVLSLAASASDPKLLVAGTLRGVFRSTDGGQRWSRISPADSKEIHNVQSVAIDPKDPNTIYAGTWHLPWKSVDGGENWSSIKDGIIEDSDVFSIIIDPEKPETVFASACSGIYKSLNGGIEFERIKGIPKTSIRTRRLLQDPHDLNTVFAGTTQGLFKSEDSGKTWTQRTGANIIVNDVEISLDDPKRVLIATDRGGVLASDDGGETFHPSNGGFSARQVTALKRDANHPQTLFVGVVNDKDWGGVFESDNGGRNWQQRSEGLEGRDVFALGQAPDGTMIAGTSHGLFRLDTAAQAWLRVESAPGTQVKNGAGARGRDQAGGCGPSSVDRCDRSCSGHNLNRGSPSGQDEAPDENATSGCEETGGHAGEGLREAPERGPHTGRWLRRRLIRFQPRRACSTVVCTRWRPRATRCLRQRQSGSSPAWTTAIRGHPPDRMAAAKWRYPCGDEEEGNRGFVACGGDFLRQRYHLGSW